MKRQLLMKFSSPWVGQHDALSARHHILAGYAPWHPTTGISVTFVKQPNLSTNGSHYTSMRRVARLGRKWVLTYVSSVANHIWSLLITSLILYKLICSRTPLENWWYIAWSVILLVMAFPAVCILTRHNSSCRLLLLSLCSHGASFTILRPRDTSPPMARPRLLWRASRICSNAPRIKLWPVLGSAWNAQYPHQDVNRIPAQIVFGHFTHSVLPVVLNPCTALDVRKRLTRQHQTNQCNDRYASPFNTLHANQPVYFQHPLRKWWTRGTIVHRIGPRSYIVKSIDGSTYKRNSVHIRSFNSRDPSPSEPQYYNTSIPVPFVSHSDVTCDSHAVPVNAQSRPVFSNAGDSSRNNNSRPQRDRRPPAWMRDYTA